MDSELGREDESWFSVFSNSTLIASFVGPNEIRCSLHK